MFVHTKRCWRNEVILSHSLLTSNELPVICWIQGFVGWLWFSSGFKELEKESWVSELPLSYTNSVA